jgi:hypothetical protein
MWVLRGDFRSALGTPNSFTRTGTDPPQALFVPAQQPNIQGVPLKYLPLNLCALALALGIIALLAWGLTPPAWLAGSVAALLMGAALTYGFTAYIPNITPWLWVKPIRGTVLVMLGICALYTPPSLIIAAYLVGVGVRLVWQSACELVEQDKLDSTPVKPLQVGEWPFKPLPESPNRSLAIPKQAEIARR